MKAILASGLDRQSDNQQPGLPGTAARTQNIRGQEYYQ